MPRRDASHRLTAALALAFSWGPAVGCALDDAAAAPDDATPSPSVDRAAASEEEPAEETSPPADSQQGEASVAPSRRADAPLLSGLGEHHHEADTDDPLAQKYFDQGLMLHFGFNHAEAIRSFQQAAELDPSCALCRAGAALSMGPNINAAMDPEKAGEAYELAQAAKELADDLSERDRLYVEAIAARYAEPPPGSEQEQGASPLGDRDALDESYARALTKLHEAFPDDTDAATLLAEALMVQHPWDYWTRTGEPKRWTPRITELLEETLEQEPEHPFANHLYIHAVEASDEPERALRSARRLEGMIPGAGHLVHMPAHVYIRTGDYHAASEANERAIAADEAYLEQVRAQGAYPLAYYPHNYHFLWATTTLEGRSEDALRAARGVAARADREMMTKPGFGTLQHYYSIPYYALVAFGRWQEILDEPPPEVGLYYPQVVWRYARGMALAHSGDLDAAEEELDHVRAAADDPRLVEITIWDINETGDLMTIAAALLEAAIAAERGDEDARIAALRRAVEQEDALQYDEPPPWGPSTRRYLGAALLEAGRPVEAQVAYEEDLEAFPKNGWALFGLLKVARRQGASERAAQLEEAFRRAWRHADVTLTTSAF